MVYTQNFELGVLVLYCIEIIVKNISLLPSNVLNVDYCCVSYFGVCEKELIPNVLLSYKFSTLIEK